MVDGQLRVIENASVDPVAPAGSVWSSVSDMARWLAFLLRGCRTEDGRALLQSATCEELFEPQVMAGNGFYPTTALTEPHWTTYGLGWFQQDYEGRKVDFHTGSIDGMVAIAGMIRDEGVGVYVLSNRDHAEVRHALMLRVLDLYDDEAPRDWSAELKELYDGIAARRDSTRAAAEAGRVEGTEPSLALNTYAGAYTHEMYGPVEVTVAADGPEGALRVTFGERQGTATHWHYDTFQVRWDREWQGSSLVTFELDTRGRPATMRAMGVQFRRQREG
jgi:CubicO group peptidase (beta-lactamase class C family)